MIVLVSLMGALVLTSGLLLVLSPAPLAPNAPSLLAADVSDGLDLLFETASPIDRGRWRRIYIHHTRSRRGNAYDNGGMKDHFLIGNGDGCMDGEIQTGTRWSRQQQATVGSSTVTDDCISIALVGDFNAKAPTAGQLQSLDRLLRALQRNLGITPDAVVVDTQGAGVAGIGRQFPVSMLRDAGR